MRELALIPGDSEYTFSDQLGEEKFLFHIWWAEEVSTAFIGVSGITNDFFIEGKALTVGVNIFGPYRTPYGSLTLVGDEHSLPTLATLGDTFRLIWLSAAEVEAL